MPNTLVHIAIQGGAGRFLSANNDRWIFLGCVIPDLSWILQRIATSVWPSVNYYDLRIYAIAQASLLFCLILSASIALLTKNRLAVFLILGINSMVHLVLDAMQIKWANGVHFLAPFSWKPSHFGLVWPENLLFPALGLIGIIVCFLAFKRAGRSQSLFDSPAAFRTVCSFALLMIYFCGPMLFYNQIYNSNSHFIKTLHEVDKRSGQQIEIDRARYTADTGDCLTLFTGEKLQCQGSLPSGSDIVSIRGTFVDAGTVKISDYHFHSNVRDFGSYLGLSAVGFLFLLSAVKVGLFSERRGNA